MAGGTDFCTSPDVAVQFERGMCDLISFFGMEKPRVLFLHVLFETKYKLNETKPTVDVQIQSCEALQSCGTQIFVFFAKHWRTRSTFDETLQ